MGTVRRAPEELTALLRFSRDLPRFLRRPIDANEARARLRRDLGRGGIVQRHMAALWRRAETVALRREPPLLTRAGKALPFRPLRQDRTGHAWADALPRR